MQVEIDPSSTQPGPATSGRVEEERAKRAKSATKSGDDASNASTREARAGGVDVAVSAQLQRARRSIEGRRADAGAGALARLERLPFEVDAIAERIRSSPRLAAIAQGDVDPARAHRLLSQVPPARAQDRAATDSGALQRNARSTAGDENQIASRVDAAQLAAAMRAMTSLEFAGAGTAGDGGARAAWLRSLGL